MASTTHYLYGYFSIRAKLQRGYTGGILTAFYLTDTNTSSNTDPKHAEIDMEIYGGHSHRDMRLGMNVFAGGVHNLVEVGSGLTISASYVYSHCNVHNLVDGGP